MRLLHLPRSVCFVCLALAALPLFGQALPPNPHRPERLNPAPALSGPLPPRQSHEGPEVFSQRISMNPLLKEFLERYTSPVWKSWLRMVLQRAQPFLGYIATRIEHYHLQPELLYLPIAE